MANKCHVLYVKITRITKSARQWFPAATTETQNLLFWSWANKKRSWLRFKINVKSCLLCLFAWTKDLCMDVYVCVCFCVLSQQGQCRRDLVGKIHVPFNANIYWGNRKTSREEWIGAIKSWWVFESFGFWFQF